MLRSAGANEILEQTYRTPYKPKPPSKEGLFRQSVSFFRQLAAYGTFDPIGIIIGHAAFLLKCKGSGPNHIEA
ncbi:hypothetical protein X474_04275 [Dethiosulfatarculus sandiegensis]|uniref:Uncharacterized protein n=1 Tax=Dethiosulfatarculus sandiegensis TaxID=1429043 RepID=A0A0D2HYY8_9BACT|nr:hypothetical protein X474_04275 [Dethiosulfatarculus sandiegensis]